ncbi:polyphosphate kinase 1 [Archangium violaceum]|uniref:polyphosphate kinase 1 n=1 Tax=Archangium violaceum TaxID=83451 RepID=UPI002B2F4C01|nr:polyphosphate kinase 1 [Archangium gephyra]
MSPVEFNDPQLFINRELSWLAFNERVLDDARFRELPLYERLKFFSIASSNLDEFFMVRVAGLKQQLASGVAEPAADGLLPAEQLSAISERVHALVDSASRLWAEELHPGLLAAGVSLVTRDKLTAEQKVAARTYFATSVFQTLTPLAVDPGHPFPHLRNKSLNVAVLLRREGPKRRRNMQGTSLAVVQVPSVLRQLVPMPGEKGLAFLLLGEVIALCAAELFPGYVVEHAAAFRVTRNWDLNVDEEESEDLLSTLQEELRRRDRGAAVRLELDASASPQMESLLTAALKLGPMDVYRQQFPLQPSDLMALTELDARPELRVESFTPTVPPVLRDVESILDVIAGRDILLHHPYESFDPVVRFLEEAAEDPDVLAIKQTLYRTSGDSPIARALSRAVENGKQVAVLVEIKARLDEANNIAWARKMEESGVHVVYGLIGLKTHAKVALVVRREGNGIRRYVHLGTGNYNPHTARLYTDLSLFTSREEIADDVSALFNMLTGYAVAPQWKRLAVAPMGLQEKVLALIQREAEKARRGEPARIVAKMNSLVDSTVIRALYAASQAGVEIELLVRGICCLRPGVPGVSERIRVTSVVDRFLEHSRVFAFGAGSNPEVWMSSADWMPRNFLRRIEAMFPVEDPVIRQRLLDEVLGVALRDNVKARRLQVDGTYVPVGRDGTAVRSQGVLMELARRNNQPDTKPLHALRHATAPDAPVPPRQVPQTGS